MPESAAEVYARVVAAVGEDGRLPVPDTSEWDIFPWAVDDGALVTRPLMAPGEETARGGEGGRDCLSCAAVHGAIWENDAWRVKHLKPSGLPIVLVLETKDHLDYAQLDDEQAAAYGLLSVRLARIIESLPNIARCHVSRWGDGSSHFHVWFFGRIEGLLATRGSFAVDWDDILPPGPEDVWRADLAAVAHKLANHDGTSLV